jgi:hypothetical protein
VEEAEGELVVSLSSKALGKQPQSLRLLDSVSDLVERLAKVRAMTRGEKKTS